MGSKLVSAYLNKVTSFGIRPGLSPSDKRAIILSNQISLVLTAIVFFIAVFIFVKSIRDNVPFPATTIAVPTIFLLPLWLNKAGWINVSRIIICVIMPGVVFASITWGNRADASSIYISSRFYLIASVAFPFLLFRVSEWIKLLIALAAPITALGFLHLLFEKSAPHLVFDLPGFIHRAITANSLVSLGIVCISFIILKRIIERNEDENLKLIEALQLKNAEVNEQLRVIEDKNDLISSQNEQIEGQLLGLTKNHDELLQSRTELKTALKTLELQKKLLEHENTTLENLLLQRNKELEMSNDELSYQNTRLTQFSNALTNNLRSPVANILGLISLMDPGKNYEEQKEILYRAREEGNNLDIIIRDLTQIIDVQHKYYSKLEKIKLADAVAYTLKLLRFELEQFNVAIKKLYLENEEVFTSRPILNSILYNLINNSIKYRFPQRIPIISIGCYRIPDYVVITVRDNGVGLDLKKHGGDMFKLYKRFHHHVPGKGLGLYLVKIQCESLGGRVEVQSEPNQYCQVSIFLPLAVDQNAEN